MTTLRFVASATACIALIASTAMAQIPDTFTNLQVLPKDISKGELMSMMRGFAGALGVRCIHCHVGDDPNSLDKVDFASDEREPKKVARAMLKMTQRINDDLLPTIGREDYLNVKCATCHHGLTEPQALDDKLLAVVADKGVDDAASTYRELREQYYGQGAYDFSARTLNSVAETLARQRKDPEGAIKLMKLNVEFNPNDASSHLMLGQLLSRQGDTAGAIASVERSLAIEPDNHWAKQLLEQLRAKQ